MRDKSIPQNEFAKSVCLFLAEMLRAHKISLGHAAEIAQKVLQNINLIDTEEDFLKFVKVLSADFEELHSFEDHVFMSVHVAKRHKLEQYVREFVITILAMNLPLAMEVLQTAMHDEVKLEDLCVKFPEFNNFFNTRKKYD